MVEIRDKTRLGLTIGLMLELGLEFFRIRFRFIDRFG